MIINYTPKVVTIKAPRFALRGCPFCGAQPEQKQFAGTVLFRCRCGSERGGATLVEAVSRWNKGF